MHLVSNILIYFEIRLSKRFFPFYVFFFFFFFFWFYCHPKWYKNNNLLHEIYSIWTRLALFFVALNGFFFISFFWNLLSAFCRWMFYFIFFFFFNKRIEKRVNCSWFELYFVTHKCMYLFSFYLFFLRHKVFLYWGMHIIFLRFKR